MYIRYVSPSFHASCLWSADVHWRVKLATHLSSILIRGNLNIAEDKGPQKRDESTAKHDSISWISADHKEEACEDGHTTCVYQKLTFCDYIVLYIVEGV